MPDFTVIDGGGERRDHAAEMAQSVFEDLALEIVRVAARGGDPEFRAARALNHFLAHAAEAKAEPATIVDRALHSFHKSIFGHESARELDRDLMDVVKCSLRLAAEEAAQDPAAAARRSSRKAELLAAIEQLMIGREERARKNGRSYLVNLAERELGKWTQPKARKTERSAKSKRDPYSDPQL